MNRTIQVAAIQMDANPAPTSKRIARADALVRDAAQAGAQLVVLPELFNTGYTYAEGNHENSETLPGPTSEWMHLTAARLGIHLTGSLMLRDAGEIYNAMLLFAPDGRMWRYDKSYPWGWERSAFRARRNVTVAHTDLGDLGMLICWDMGHTNLWRQYAGKVDLMVVASCPPDVTDPTYNFPNGAQVTLGDMGPLIAQMRNTGHLVFRDMFRQQAAWLGVPAVNTVGCGHITTPIPNARNGLLSMGLIAPWLLKLLPGADQMSMSCAFLDACQIVDARGQTIAERSQGQGERFTLGTVTLQAEKPQPSTPQPGSPMHLMAYLLADVLLPMLSLGTYKRGKERIGL